MSLLFQQGEGLVLKGSYVSGSPPSTFSEPGLQSTSGTEI